MLTYWYHYSHNQKRIEVETDDDSVGGHFLHLLHGKKPSDSWVKAMHVSLILYAEHEFNASTFAARVIAGTASDIYSCITGAIGALRGPKHGGANEVAFDIQKRYSNPDEAEQDILKRLEKKEVIIGFGHPVYTIGDPRNEVIKKVARRLGLQWGVHAVHTRDVNNFEEMVGKAKRMVLRHHLAEPGDKVLLMAGVPFKTAGSTNVIHVVAISGDELDNYSNEA
jgi:citrate synthase